MQLDNYAIVGTGAVSEDAMPLGIVVRVEGERGFVVALFESGRLKEGGGSNIEMMIAFGKNGNMEKMPFPIKINVTRFLDICVSPIKTPPQETSVKGLQLKGSLSKLARDSLSSDGVPRDPENRLPNLPFVEFKDHQRLSALMLKRKIK